jgi:hypothetical protein
LSINILYLYGREASGQFDFFIIGLIVIFLSPFAFNNSQSFTKISVIIISALLSKELLLNEYSFSLFAVLLSLPSKDITFTFNIFSSGIVFTV